MDSKAPLSALQDALGYLWVHIALCFFVATLVTGLSFFKNRQSAIATKEKSWLAEKFMSVIAFCFLGLVTGFFLAQGYSARDRTNSMAVTIGSALIPAVSAGIAFFETGGDVNKPRSGVLAFLVIALISYQTFVQQALQVG